MTDLNKVVLIGRITRDLGENDFGYIANGSARANVSIAVNRSKKQGDEWIDEVSYFDITIWGKTAENLKPYLTKGQQIAIEGFLKQDRWETDGQKRSKVTIIAEKTWLLGGRKDNNSGNSNNAGSVNNYQNYAPSNNSDTFADEGFPEDVPF